MSYTKPQLMGFAALVSIQTSGQNAKTQSVVEIQSPHFPSEPAYEADE